MSAPGVALPDGLVAVVKRDCPTCVLVEPVLRELGAAVWCQDDADWFDHDDTELELSYRLGIETVPTLMRVESGEETARVVGWSREQWEGLTGVPGQGLVRSHYHHPKNCHGATAVGTHTERVGAPAGTWARAEASRALANNQQYWRNGC